MTSTTPHFAALCLDYPHKTSIRTQTRPEHLSWVSANDSPIYFGGPLRHDQQTAPHGSLIFFTSADYHTASQFITNDPYAKVDLFQSVELYQLQIVHHKQQMPSKLILIRSIFKNETHSFIQQHAEWWQNHSAALVVAFLKNDNQIMGDLVICNSDNVDQIAKWNQLASYSEGEVVQNCCISPFLKVMEQGELVKQ